MVRLHFHVEETYGILRRRPDYAVVSCLGVWMAGVHDDFEEAQPATVMAADSPVVPSADETDGTNASPPMSGDTTMRSPISVGGGPPARMRLLLMICAALCLVSVLLVLLFANGGDLSASQARSQPTATATTRPTVTPTPPDGITPMPGFAVYKDQVQGFIIQYPYTWTYTPANPGIEFDDDSNSPGYIVQVLVPGDATSAGNGAQQNDAAAWVSYELGNLSKQWQGNFEQVPGPSPDVRIGGVVWQTGMALLGSSTSRARVQVYATVYHGKPYIINVLTAENEFTFGSHAYFEPMLRSFVFLPQNG